ISTLGLVPGIKKLADLKKQFGLSISLHAADDALRNRLMPVNKKYPIKDVLEAAKYFFENTKRQVTFEYILFRDLNDDPANADRLAQLLKSLPYPLQKVNLLLFNETLRGEFRSSDISKAEEFQQNLKKKLISATIRRPRGRDIAAACGQLRSRLKPS
ncbi:MAG TPA: 23S rRNA (adenine(2503)-C(2))-methyltransferase RlmN, partial [bacterium]|nr:23S rRNA (adenine(2503)-C(2))-methyltransferase RlmN [bacterium]